MTHRNRKSLAASTLVLVLGAHSTGAAVLSDDFDGPAGAPNAATWATGATSGTVAIDGSSHFIATVLSGGSSQRAVAVTNAGDFNPFAAPLTIALDGIAVGGTPTGAFANVGYVLLGRTDAAGTTQFTPSGNGMAFGIGVNIRKEVSDAYELNLQQYSNLSGSGLRINSTFGLSGTPTGLTLDIDATGAVKTITMTISGATFTDSSLASKSWNLHDDFNLANLTDGGNLASHLAIGAQNSGNVTAGSVFTVDSINVSSVPEPAALGLMGAGLLFAAARPRRP